MDEHAVRIQALYRLAVEQLASDSALRDALDDDQAQRLVNWGLARIRSSAEAAATLPQRQSDEVVSEIVQAVRTVMMRVNDLVDKQVRGSGDVYVAVLQFVEALHDLTLQPLPAQHMETLQALAQPRGDLSSRDVFSKLMALIEEMEM